MKTLIAILIRLYPASWRSRYAAELQALLEDTPADARAIADLLKGALRMQLSVRSFPRLALLLSTIGLATGLATSYLVTPRFTSAATMGLSDEFDVSVPHPAAPELLMQREQEILSRRSLSAIIQDPRLDLYPRERLSLPLEDVISTMRTRDLRITLLDKPGQTTTRYIPFEVSFTYPDGEKAQQVTQTIISRFVEETLFEARKTATRHADSEGLTRLKARIAVLERRLNIPPAPDDPAQLKEPPDGMRIIVLDPPSRPETAVFPNRSLFMAVGFVTGILLALLLTLVRYSQRPVPNHATLA